MFRLPCLSTALAATLTLALLPSPAGHAQDAPTAPLLVPATLIVDASLPAAQRKAQTLAARRYATFWNNGDPALEQQALAADFIDRTLPPGRRQGRQGPLDAYRTMHTASPDLRAQVQQMIVAGDRVVVHFRFRGHFSGRFGDSQGHGQPIDFVATDIYRIAHGQIVENWHIEDNLTLLTQLGVVAP